MNYIIYELYFPLISFFFFFFYFFFDIDVKKSVTIIPSIVIALITIAFSFTKYYNNNAWLILLLAALLGLAGAVSNYFINTKAISFDILFLLMYILYFIFVK